MVQEDGKKLKYYQLMEDLKEQILTGKFQAGDKLPSENELASRYRVSRQTVRKALGILENAGYIYAEHGKGTFCSELVKHSHSSRNIAVVTTYLSDYIFPRVIKGIDDSLTKEGYSIILKNTRNSRSLEAKCLEELLQKDIDGLIVEPSKSHVYCRHVNLYDKLDEFKIPYVFIQGQYLQMEEKPSVLMDDCKGGYLVTKHLIELGHREIVGVFKADDFQGQNRHKGYVKAQQEAGIPYNPEHVIWFYTEDREVHPYDCIRRMVKNKKRIDAVVCYNDETAVRVISVLRRMGIRVPEDVSITGYDNSYMANFGELKLTTIAHPQERLGKMAAELLVELIKNQEIPGEKKHILIEPEIVPGNSTVRNRKIQVGNGKTE
jgi:GntR family transcriptional regulator of arabinose operon